MHRILLLQATNNGSLDVYPSYYYILFYGLMFLVFWYFFIRKPIQKQKKEHQLRESLKKGDKVVTIGGIHGKIVSINDNTVIIENEGSRLRVEKSAISVNPVS